MHSKPDIRYRPVVAPLLWAFDWLVIVFLGKIPRHIVLSGLVVGPVVNGTLVEVLCEGLLLVIDFPTTFDRTWKVLASFLWILLSVFIIATSKTRLIFMVTLRWSVRSDHLEDLPWLVLNYGHLDRALNNHILVVVFRGFYFLFQVLILVI